MKVYRFGGALVVSCCASITYTHILSRKRQPTYICMFPFIMRCHELVKNWHQSAGCVKEKRVWNDLKVNAIDGVVLVVESELRNRKKSTKNSMTLYDSAFANLHFIYYQAYDPDATVFVNGW